jgi:tetratricopeptide (TPR) repeat protein
MTPGRRNNPKALLSHYFAEASSMLRDAPTTRDFSTPGLVDYLNEHLPDDFEEFTIPKVNYLRHQGILKPTTVGEGGIRRSWRYSIQDARIALLVELLKVRAGMGVHEAGVLLHNLSGDLTERTGDTSHRADASPMADTPRSRTSAYTLLRNRTLGMLLTGLSQGEATSVPHECLVAIRACDPGSCEPRVRVLPAWEEGPGDGESRGGPRSILESGSWHLAAAVRHGNLYFYHDLDILLQNISVSEVSDYRWWIFMLEDTKEHPYEVVLGLTPHDLSEPAVNVIGRTLDEYAYQQQAIDMARLPGLATLLGVAFGEEVDAPDGEGTTLSVLAEIIANAATALDYCAILAPQESEDGVSLSLAVLAYSAKFREFPRKLRDARISGDRFVSGWCFYHHLPVVVQPVVENDPRIAFYPLERPVAVAAVPAQASGHRTVGVVYVGRSHRPGDQESGDLDPIFTDELLAGLEAFGYICGDMIARDEVEVETVHGLSQLNNPKTSTYKDVGDILRLVVQRAQQSTASATPITESWYHVLTLNIESYDPRNLIARWLCNLAKGIVSDFLTNRIWEAARRAPHRAAYCEVGPGQFVFAIVDTVNLPEEVFKLHVMHLQEELDHLRLEDYVIPCVLWAVPIGVEDVQQQLDNHDETSVLGEIEGRVLEALWASPHVHRAHVALREANLVVARWEFEKALRTVEKALRTAKHSWYIHKHLGEVRALEGHVSEAIRECELALALNERYASAHCLLADCLAQQGDHFRAIKGYETATALADRSDFLVRYGFALTGISEHEYAEVVGGLSMPEKCSIKPYQDAIEKFDRALKLELMKLSSRPFPSPEARADARRAREVEFYFRRGFAYLQASLLDNDHTLLERALQEFGSGRALDPDNMNLAQAYVYALRHQRDPNPGYRGTKNLPE